MHQEVEDEVAGGCVMAEADGHQREPRSCRFSCSRCCHYSCSCRLLRPLLPLTFANEDGRRVMEEKGTRSLALPSSVGAGCAGRRFSNGGSVSLSLRLTSGGHRVGMVMLPGRVLGHLATPGRRAQVQRAAAVGQAQDVRL
jgi:hypothetical protein